LDYENAYFCDSFCLLIQYVIFLYLNDTYIPIEEAGSYLYVKVCIMKNNFKYLKLFKFYSQFCWL
jgi:hypothetical protein